MESNTNLLRKYNVQGPRYTSYPTVPYWSETPTEAQWIEHTGNALDESESKNIGASLYIHIPFCQSLCTYCGCNTRITRKRSVGAPYVQTVLKEWELYRQKLNRKITVNEIHLGGGTPTFLSAAELDTLIGGILSTVKVSAQPEFSLEADPRVTHADQLKILYDHGFRRLSLGIQDFDPKVQEIVHRVQSEEQVDQLTKLARQMGYSGINYDLIYGLPLQTEQSIRTTIDAICRLRPDRIAFYSYAHVPWIRPGQRRFTENDLPVGEAKRALYELGRTMLEEVGYREVGMDHFALESDSLWKASKNGTLHRNFMGYIPKQVAPLIGLGVSAIGDAWSAFSQNEKLLETYVSRVEKGEIPILRGHVLSQEDLIIRRHILNLMTKLVTDWNDPQLMTPHLVSVSERLKELEDDGLVKLSRNRCEVTEKGRPVLRNVCMAFDSRLVQAAPKTRLFSQTI